MIEVDFSQSKSIIALTLAFLAISAMGFRVSTSMLTSSKFRTSDALLSVREVFETIWNPENNRLQTKAMQFSIKQQGNGYTIP